MNEVLGRRSFTVDDQQRFAGMTGDHNPLHMDPVAARRTQAGVPVVHGLHTLLWCIDRFAARYPDVAPIANVKIRFDRLLRLGETVECVLTRLDGTGFRMDAEIGGGVGFRLAATFGPPRDLPVMELPGSGRDILAPAEPMNLSLEEMAGRSGHVGFAVPPEELAREFPSAARQWGERRVAALACTTRLVGMVCPGLHSIFGGLTLNFCHSTDSEQSIGFKVTATDPRFRVVRLAISGGGLAGTVDSFARFPPIQQASIADLARHVMPEEFTGATAMVLGGSRGLGEVTAKLLAAGGAHVLLTYASGSSEAARIQQQIQAWGGACDVLRYDVLGPVPEQLAKLAEAPTHLYYFATPSIFQQKSGLYARARFHQFCDFYVDAFYAVCQQLAAKQPGRLSVFYPSSVAVETRPGDMTEYAMAKMAGEALCADMNAQWANVRVTVSRIPRVLTDQTASLMQAESADPVGVMLPIIRQVQAAE